MTTFIRISDLTLRWLLIIGLLVLVACVVWQVSSRCVFGAPSTVTDEIGRFTLMWYGLVAAAYVLGQRRHLAIDFFSTLEAGPKRRALSLVLTGLIVLVALAMLVGGMQLALKTIASGQITPTLRIPMGYVYFAVPVSAALMLVYCLDIARTAPGPGALGPNDTFGANQD
jgi:TRAP-type C4-dicarboxylate transport system permease small subunit